MMRYENNVRTYNASEDNLLKDGEWRVLKSDNIVKVGSSSNRNKCLHVKLQWPNLKRVRMTSVFLGVKVGQIAIYGLISFNLFSELVVET